MIPVLKTAPTAYPLSLKEVKEHLNITVGWTEDDNYLKTLLYTATQKAETYLHRRLITQTWYTYYDKWPCESYFVLPYGQLQSVTSIKYTDTASAQSTWSAAEYNTDTDSDPGRVTLEYGYTWPTTTLHPQNPIEIEFVCGYGDSGSDVDSMIKHGIKVIIDDLYNNRGNILAGISSDNLQISANILSPLRIYEEPTQ